jgi:hypothetical protein
MGLKTFVDKGGFKLLAVSRLSTGGYATVCYLLNCLAAGVEEVVTSYGELSVLLGIPERLIRTSIQELADTNIVLRSQSQGAKNMILRLNLDPNMWRNLRKETQKKKRPSLGDAHNVRSLRPQKPTVGNGHQPLREVAAMEMDPGKGMTPREALVFPSSSFHKRDNSSQDSPSHLLAEQQVLERFSSVRGTSIDREKELAYAGLLCENHPLDQILSIIDAFGKEVPSLGLLAGAWLHYSERINHLEKEELSLEAYRRKSETMLRKLRQLAAAELKRAQSLKVTLSAEEELLLRIFMRHEQPRKQLYWALQVRERYPHLKDFFSATQDMALKAPSTGQSRPQTTPHE